MKSNIKFPENELNQYKENQKLLDEWVKHLKNNTTYQKYSTDYFVRDGFFPNYYNQKLKILYIGIEPRDLSGCDYIDFVYHGYKNNGIGRKPLNNSKFHRLMLKIAYGLINDFLEWEKIPNPYPDISNNFGSKNGISFAIMELSKYSNDTGKRDKVIHQIQNFIRISKNAKKNYWNEQIRIFNPDLIISMQLAGHLHELGKLDRIKKAKLPKPSVYELNVEHKKIKIIDTYHFSNNWKIRNEKAFYNSIMNTVKSLFL